MAKKSCVVGVRLAEDDMRAFNEAVERAQCFKSVSEALKYLISRFVHMPDKDLKNFIMS